MSWDVLVVEWLIRAAAGGFLILAVAAIAVRFCRQPADRVRIIELALAGAVLAPWAALIPGLPRWHLEVLPPEPAQATTASEQVAAASEPEPGASSVEPSAGYRPQPVVPRPELTAGESTQQPVPHTATAEPSSAAPAAVEAPSRAAPAALSERAGRADRVRGVDVCDSRLVVHRPLAVVPALA